MLLLLPLSFLLSLLFDIISIPVVDRNTIEVKRFDEHRIRASIEIYDPQVSLRYLFFACIANVDNLVGMGPR